ncbi:FAD-dependent oxidoreductase [Mesobaculum littorinae]|uniref:FAD-dependent oxidoreductase n=1 Tax=Mesobaculum littorinae TaxID=2486419 RepID=A0A438AHL3_9RHOB|nr:FAD-dependent oxidoreductase [Mesobaculum littorinae]RVV98190.1 FAD-dependent oxidoreductase [Mesobaculum littorinae]
MPFEKSGPGPKRIAVVGGGISGLGAAHALSRTHAVTLYEAEPRLGGHARTVMAGRNGDQPVDTGFIVFNRATYPNMVKLFEDLGVPIADSDMSFGASIRGGRLEYGLRNLAAVFCQRRNAADPRFLRMLRDILRFNKRAEATATPGMTIGHLLDRLGTGAWFRDYYLLPLSGAIWSTPTSGILDFPAEALLRFFRNHALLHHSGQHQWYTVRGGSVEYVRRLEAALLRRGAELRKGTPVGGIRRLSDGGVVIETAAAGPELFDEVVLATHSDDSLRLLSDPDEEEKRLLGAVRYQPNRAVLHADTGVMPKRRGAWSSWVYSEPDSGPCDRIDLTYWMNSLQPIPKDDPLFVTLNGCHPVRDELIHDEVEFRHPVYDHAALAAQEGVRARNGARSTWFCGAWMRNGFHEDGLASGLEVAGALAARDPAPIAAA